MRPAQFLAIAVTLAAVAVAAVAFSILSAPGPGTVPAPVSPVAVPVTPPAHTTAPVTVAQITGGPRAPVSSAVPTPLKTIAAPANVSRTVAGTVTTMTTPPFPVPAGPAPGDPYTLSPGGLAGRVHELVNQVRVAHGLPVLAVDPALAGLALNYSRDMAARNFFDHVNPAGLDSTARATAAGYSCRKEYGSYYTYGIAENLFQTRRYSSVTYYSNGRYVYDWTSPEEIAVTVVGGWMNSSGHRKNLLTPTFDREGIGVAVASDDRVYVTEDFC